ncbi:Pectate trisaccharide-lyase precursor [Posidoniimonas corsicana]|uniref:Probable pectate lyase C n=1 Tax=Posidoniimonas corsicana TaxID=1938618 RepID=A0A5C5V8F5_9BACT|nr:right-handed parallel beta-helix repeat-containing protein [Posidoniimonas corsicana]TWT34045.1 Pectate trisaccharide-lyase precursor [Posidoniimonas corsicana]
MKHQMATGGVARLSLIAALLAAQPAAGVTYQASGFASVAALGRAGTNGGGDGPVVVVDNQAALEHYLAGDTPRTVAIRGSIEISEFGKELTVGSNKTVLGLGDDAELVYGGLRVINESNVVIRNLTIRDSFVEGDWDGKTQDFDGIQVDNSHHVWIDHVHLTRMGDGLIDLRQGGLDYVTISNSILSEHNKALGVGWTDESDQHVTIHHTWIHDTHQRNPSFDNVIGHFYNNLMEDVTSYGLNPRNNAVVVSENNIFDNVNRPYNIDGDAELVARGDVLTNSPNADTPTGDAFDPREFYDYTLTDTRSLRDYVMANAGPQAAIGVLPLFGDYNDDGQVDAADYTVWRDSLGAQAGALPNDPHLGPIGDAQYQTWRANFGQTREPATFPFAPTAAPEPAAALLLMLLLAAAAIRWTRRPVRLPVAAAA